MLVFDAANSPNLPTLMEEDVAVVARLVAENRRPGFNYIPISQNHPFHGRQYKQYCPQWLRGTSVGDLLSETDWSMKCLCIGARSNDDKTQFWGWQKTSKLEGLGTLADFISERVCGNVRMSCKAVEIKKSDKQLVFIGEPKMLITDGTSPTYSDYITAHNDSVAYYDEPLFLKMKELI